MLYHTIEGNVFLVQPSRYSETTVAVDQGGSNTCQAGNKTWHHLHSTGFEWIEKTRFICP